ncbi:MAG: hypothetical protein J6P30_01790 [Fibrobacter sp.]|nr:hypothetical protein [Fibrobacter sp.]
MARTFNAGIWGNIGDAVARDNMLRRESNREAMGGLLDMAKFIEKANANRKLREDWQDYFAGRKAAADAALAEEAAAETDDIEDALLLEDMYNDSNVFGLEQPEDDIYGSIWGGPLSTDDPVNNVARFGFDPMTAAADAEFMQSFDPKTATDEEIRRAQAIVGTGVDGKWGPLSIAARNKYMGV